MTDPTPLADRLRASADEWLPTNDHSFRAHGLLTEAAAELERQAADIAHKDAYAEQLGRELAKAGAEAERTARNRDMWKGQCERQAAELERMRAALENWKATVWAVARELDCLPSTFSDGNGHVLKAAIKHMADARRYRWLRDDTDSDWAICEWSTREVDGIGYYRDSRRPDIVDAAIDAARAAADSQQSAT